MPVEVGMITDGKVKNIMPFGAFVDIGEGNTGLVHISEVDISYVKDIKDFLSVGDSVRVKVLSMEKGKINLSIKKAMEEEKKKTSRPVDVDWSQSAKPGLAFEDMLSKFKQESDEKIQGMKAAKDSRRRGY